MPSGRCKLLVEKKNIPTPESTTWVEISFGTAMPMLERLVVLVGEAPGNGYDPERHAPLYPYPTQSAGARLQRMTGLSLREYVDRTARINLLPQAFSLRWSDTQARWAAISLMRGGLLDGRNVVLVGSKVREAFFPGLEWTPCEWSAPKMSELRGGYSNYAFIPHPSGRNLWYNQADNKAMVQTFFKSVFDRAPA